MLVSSKKSQNPMTAQGDAPSSKADFSTTRRNLIASVVLVGSLLSAKAAKAGGYYYGDHKDYDRHKGGYCPRPVCFLAGTRIATPHGEVPIEDLKIGDLVTTVSGAARPVKWVWRMRIARNGAETWHADVAPVKIARGALDGHAPHADLYVSSAHALYIDGLLIRARLLVNGRSITSCRDIPAAELVYYHIELDSHDVILAEGAAAETFQASASRREKFENADEYERLYGAATIAMLPYAPIVALNGKERLWSHLRSAVAPVYDLRRPVDVIRDEIGRRAERQIAA